MCQTVRRRAEQEQAGFRFRRERTRAWLQMIRLRVKGSWGMNVGVWGENGPRIGDRKNTKALRVIRRHFYHLANDILRVGAVDAAADGDGGSEDLLDGAGKLLCTRPGAHDTGDLDNIVKRDVSSVLYVFLLRFIADKNTV